MKKLSKNNIITIALIIAIYAIVFVLEKVIDSNSMLFIVLKKGAIYALVAVSMNLLNGFTGLFSLGQAGFMLIGAYAYAIFTIPVEYRDAVYQYFDGGIVQFSIPVIPALILAGLAAALFAFLIGLPVLRLKSDYLAIATLGFAEIIRAFFQWDTLGPVTNGSNLLRKFPTFDSTLFPFTVAGICILLIVLLINSSYGRAFKAIRDDEIAAEAMGINLFKHKEMSFVISSFFAGVGGALPRPRKLKVENMRIWLPISVVAIISTELMLLGMTSLIRMRSFEAPRALEAVTYSFSFTLKTTLRIRRA